MNSILSKTSYNKHNIKPHSCIPSSIIIRVFKDFLARAAKICSEKYLRREIDYLTARFCKNGFDQKLLQKIISNFEKKPRNINNNAITTLKKAKNTLICGSNKVNNKVFLYKHNIQTTVILYSVLS